MTDVDDTSTSSEAGTSSERKLYCWPDNARACKGPVERLIWLRATKEGMIWREGVCLRHLDEYKKSVESKGYIIVSFEVRKVVYEGEAAEVSDKREASYD